MMREPLLLIGAGGHAMSCIDVIEQQGDYQIAGLIGRSYEVGKKLLNYPIIGRDDDLPNLIKTYKYALVTAGQIKSSALRIKLFEYIYSVGFKLPKIVSPHAYVSRHAHLGEGTIVMHGAMVNAGVTIGKNCIVNSRALIEHGASIADHCHISTASIINGDVTIGRGTFVGSASCIRQSVTIGDNCLIGMGQSVFVNYEHNTHFTRRREKA